MPWRNVCWLTALYGKTDTEPAFFNELIRRVLSGESGEVLDLELQTCFGLKDRRIPRGLPTALAGTLKDLRDSGIRAKAALLADQEGILYKEAPVETATLALHARMSVYSRHFTYELPRISYAGPQNAAPTHPWISQQKMISLYGSMT